MLKLPEIDRALIVHDVNLDKPLAVCLCAGWCNNCEEWKNELAQLSDEHRDCCFVWLDIDEHPDMVAEVDLDVLPVLALYKGEEVAFLGPIRPDKQTVSTLIKSARAYSQIDDPGLRDFLTESNFIN